MKISIGIYRNELYEELAGHIKSSLDEAGHDASITGDADRSAMESDALLLVGDLRFFSGYAEIFRDSPHPRPRTILWQLDPLPPQELSGKLFSGIMRNRTLNKVVGSNHKYVISAYKRLSIIARLFEIGDAGYKHYRESSPKEVLDTIYRYGYLCNNRTTGWPDRIAASTVPKLNYLRDTGIDSDLVPFGYHPGMGVDTNTQRDIDVLCIGRLNLQRRRDKLELISDELGKLGLGLLNIPGPCYGNERTAILNRSKLSLNILAHTWDFTGLRFLLYMACGSMVVSEKLRCDTTPFVPGVHFVETGIEDMPSAIKYYLEHDKERSAIVNNAKALISDELTLKRSLTRLLDGIV
jgi:Glycosyl transferases group 1